MIEFDEAEFLNSAVSDETLYLVLLFCGPDTRDKLLYGGDVIVEPARTAI
ncbi:hypothetical protein [Paenibacillus riograndensis]|nr:hypothetical protein [Paenibacillus riograndensis]